MKGFDQQGDYSRQSSPRTFVGMEPPQQFLADSQASQTGFSRGPEEIFFPREMTEDCNFANPRQAGDFMGAAGRKALA
jgi:hypothetical protein